MLREAKVTVLMNHRLREPGGVTKKGATLTEITMENGASFTATIFMDSSYEGDLMAQAKVSYTWGREGRRPVRRIAGRRAQRRRPSISSPSNLRRASHGKLLPEIYDQPVGQRAAADRKVQAYNFRMCFSDDPAAQVRIPQAARIYARKRYELLARLLKARTAAEGQGAEVGTLLKIDASRITRRTSTTTALSPPTIGRQLGISERRLRQARSDLAGTQELHRGPALFLANDPQVPAETQTEMRRWGLCKDEFTDTDNWPFQIYIRESRRMVGEYVAIQKDLQTDLTKPDAIGMGSYNSDSHNIERIADANGFVRNEGDMQVPVVPYQIPFRIMLPKSAEATNLLVPVAFSASHVAYSSLRMEPQYMMLGQAAGLAAKLALEAHVPVQKVDVHALQSTLISEGTILQYSPSGQEKAMQIVGKHVPRKRR